MAIGFGSVDSFQDTIQATLDNGVDFARSQLPKPNTPSRTCCIDCHCTIPERRRTALVGCIRCVQCQSEHDMSMPSIYNRRGSKDSQLR